MDQLTIFERLQKIIDAYEQTLNKRYDQLQTDMLLVLDDYYTKYGESIGGYTKYNRLLSLKKQLDQTATAHYTQLAQDLQQATEDTFKESYLLYAYLIHMYLGEEDGRILPLTKTAAKTSAVIALVLLLLKRAKKPLAYFTDEQVDVLEVLEKHKNDYVYGVFNDIKTNLRGEAGYVDASTKVKKRTKSAKGYGVSRLYELLNDVINYVQDKVYEACKEHVDVSKLWCSMKDHRVREAHQDLDGKFSDDGWFYHSGDKARRPKGFLVLQSLNWGCRCKLFLSFNGAIPKVSKIYDYTDGKYRIKVDNRIEELQKQGKTYIQALQQAQKEIKPPRKTLDYFIIYEDWLEEYGKYE